MGARKADVRALPTLWVTVLPELRQAETDGGLDDGHDLLGHFPAQSQIGPTILTDGQNAALLGQEDVVLEIVKIGRPQDPAPSTYAFRGAPWRRRDR